MIIEVVDYSKTIEDKERYQQFTEEQLSDVAKLTGRSESSLKNIIVTAEERKAQYISFAVLNGEEALMIPNEPNPTDFPPELELSANKAAPRGAWVNYDYDNGIEVLSIHDKAEGAVRAHEFGRIAFVPFGEKLPDAVKKWEERSK